MANQLNINQINASSKYNSPAGSIFVVHNLVIGHSFHISFIDESHQIFPNILARPLILTGVSIFHQIPKPEPG